MLQISGFVELVSGNYYEPRGKMGAALEYRQAVATGYMPETHDEIMQQ